MNHALSNTTFVELAGREIPVPADRLYARYRMATDLDAVAADPRVPGTEFFRSLPKTRVESRIGPTLTPNFYYAASIARLVMLAPAKRLRARLPRELAPLEVLPGVGIFSIMLFRYDVCDIDFYTEAATGIAVRPARHAGPGIADLAASLQNDDLHSYVLSLPVNTEIAQIRGHDGYGFPKWVTPIDVDIDERHVAARVTNDQGGTDLAITATTPPQKAHQPLQKVSTGTSYTRIDGDWHATVNQIHTLKSGRALRPRGLDLTLGEGRLSDDVRSVGAQRVLALDVTTSAQIALHMPTPTSVDPRR